MKTIDKWDDLTPFGIDPLTAEACGLGYRILCDVTAAGKHIMEKCLGLRDLGAQPPWNRGPDDAPHVGSVMLAPQLLIPLGIFALLEAGCAEVWLYKNGSLLGLEPHDPAERREEWKRPEHCPIVRVFAYRGTAGDRNVHRITGRVE